MNRRGFIGSILAAGIAPAFIRNAMAVRVLDSGLIVPARHSVLYVRSTDGSDDGDGVTWATAKRTIAAATALVAAGGTVYVGSGHYENDTLDCRKATIVTQGHTLIRNSLIIGGPLFT